MDFLELRKNHGKEDPVAHIFFRVWYSGLQRECRCLKVQCRKKPQESLKLFPIICGKVSSLTLVCGAQTDCSHYLRPILGKLLMSQLSVQGVAFCFQDISHQLDGMRHLCELLVCTA